MHSLKNKSKKIFTQIKPSSARANWHGTGGGGMEEAGCWHGLWGQVWL